MDKLTLIVNTNGDLERNKLYLGDKILPASSVSLELGTANAPQLVVRIPVMENNLEVKIDTLQPTDIEIIEAQAVKK
jgi:hypothetical protein